MVPPIQFIQICNDTVKVRYVPGDFLDLAKNPCKSSGWAQYGGQRPVDILLYFPFLPRGTIKIKVKRHIHIAHSSSYWFAPG